MSNPSQLFLLADHIKLSLLEWQRAKNLNPDDDALSGDISRSVEQLRNGIASLDEESARLQQAGDLGAAQSITESLPTLHKQFDELISQYHSLAGTSPSPPSDQEPNEEADELSSSAQRSSRKSKTVRFSEAPQSPSQELFGRYRDDPNASNDSLGYSDHANGLTNQQIHQYHSQILQEQDDHLDRLGESIGRQRELSMQIGDELESHMTILDEVDHVTSRHQSRLDRAKRALGRVAKSASDNKQMAIIFVLIVILVLLIAILK
ncbi:syntaxin 8 [Trichoderma arundinaceum]|uniref:Syntaxin 8 n=1 Tax=Trichoderma arundinaceum TaxID=490622 RepID=A0A395N8G2_TRIAR|nr:syntaxin 8 [Trichoderma arundinaceum]